MSHIRNTFAARLILVIGLLLALCSGASAYSVLTHEEIVDMLWKDQIRPMLLARYPGMTEEQLKDAHAYAYGGAVIQDLGYYPFGSHDFSDLVHYVRSGDFVVELIRDSQDANEYAFALGALAHYCSDTEGHPAVNQSVAIEFPQLARKYGKSVTYAQDKTAHIRTEFGFDVVQVAKGRYTSQAYHDFIGFEVSKPLLERVFPRVYGVQFKDLIKHEDLAIGTYRYSISNLVPHMTNVALHVRKQQIVKEWPNFHKRQFLYRISRADYQRQWGRTYQRPGFGTRFLALILRVVPKVGPFKALAFKDPTPKTEDLYFKSINSSVERYRTYLKESAAGTLSLPNRDFDTGKITQPGEYSLSDDTYGRLVRRLADAHFKEVGADLRDNVLQFYVDPAVPLAEIKDKKKREATVRGLDELKTQQPATAAAAGEQ